MLMFILLTMMMGGVVLLSASLFYLNSGNTKCTNRLSETAQQADGTKIDEIELSCIPSEDGKDQESSKDIAQILEFTRTSHKSSKQLPLLGMPDKAFYHIH